MSVPTWTAPTWTGTVPNVTFAPEIQLLTSFAQAAPGAGCRVVPSQELNFETSEFADLVIERRSDNQRLMFGMIKKGPKDPDRIDVLTRPKTGHAVLLKRADSWRLVLGGNFMHPQPVESLGLTGLLRALLDDRA